MIRIIAILSIIALWLDITAYKRMYGHRRHAAWLLSLYVADDLLPLLAAGLFTLLPDNPTGVVMCAMWIMFIYMATVPPRIVYLVFTLWSRRRVWRIAGAALAAAMILLLIYSAAVTRTDYRVNRFTLRSDDLPAAFDGYTVAVISDLHVGSMICPEKETRRIVDIVNSLDADLAVFCGDLINVRCEELTPAIRGILSSVEARDGVVSVTGNHDTGTYIRDEGRTVESETAHLIAIERDMGWRVLDDSTEWIRRGPDSICVSGISFRDEWQQDRHSGDVPDLDTSGIYADVGDRDFNITLSHIPQLWETISRSGKADLTLSGHVHAMQCKLPIGKRGISPAMLLYKRWSGSYRRGDAYLYINDGIGCVGIPARIGACPEITLFRLECSPD